MAELKMPVAVWHGELDHLVRLLPRHWDAILAVVTATAQANEPTAG